eukprot:375633_1
MSIKCNANFNPLSNFIIFHALQKEGFLEKQSRHMQIWRKRWVTVVGTKLLTYKNETNIIHDNEKKTECLDLRIFSKVVVDQSNKCSFQICSHDTNFVFRSQSQSDALEWVYTLNKIIQSNTEEKINADEEEDMMINIIFRHCDSNMIYDKFLMNVPYVLVKRYTIDYFCQDLFHYLTNKNKMCFVQLHSITSPKAAINLSVDCDFKFSENESCTHEYNNYNVTGNKYNRLLFEKSKKQSIYVIANG